MNSKFYWLSAAHLLSSTALSSFLLIQQYITTNVLSSPELVGILLAVNFLPKVVFIPIGGYIADRYSKRALLFNTTFLRIILLLWAAYFSYAGSLAMEQLYVISFVFGILDAIFIPTANSCLPYIVSNKKLHKANSIFSACYQLGVIIGPLVISILIDDFSLTDALISTVIILIICSLATLQVLTEPVSQNGLVEGPVKSILSGYEVIKKINMAQDLGFLTITSFFFIGVLTVLTPSLAAINFGSNAKYIGSLNAIYGVGIIAFSLFAQFSKSSLRVSLLTATMMLSILIIMLSQTTTYILSSIIYFICGFIISWVNVSVITTAQQRSPKELVGKTIALIVFSSQVCLPLSFGLISLLINLNFSVPDITLIYGIGFMILSVVVAYIRHSFNIKALRE
ncbi:MULTISPECIES: MFS transporter [Vibrio]|uniref:MFS transporter n=2 Tax=Vibrio TaxID=662 RepID=A0A7X4RSQ3_9VIBR|nr:MULTISPECIES: MFS transporter [Vibrio]MBF9003125.1 MFS transporter [Vibrio nitrifigilis]MZI91851.1 MFS transporter [Vibrio eleionomae]